MGEFPSFLHGFHDNINEVSVLSEVVNGPVGGEGFSVIILKKIEFKMEYILQSKVGIPRILFAYRMGFCKELNRKVLHHLFRIHL